MWGGVRAVEQLQAIFGYRNAYIYPERVFMPGIGKLLDENGQMINAEVMERLRTQQRGFVDFVNKVRA